MEMLLLKHYAPCGNENNRKFISLNLKIFYVSSEHFEIFIFGVGYFLKMYWGRIPEE